METQIKQDPVVDFYLTASQEKGFKKAFPDVGVFRHVIEQPGAIEDLYGTFSANPEFSKAFSSVDDFKNLLSVKKKDSPEDSYGVLQDTPPETGSQDLQEQPSELIGEVLLQQDEKIPKVPDLGDPEELTHGKAETLVGEYAVGVEKYIQEKYSPEKNKEFRALRATMDAEYAEWAEMSAATGVDITAERKKDPAWDEILEKHTEELKAINDKAVEEYTALVTSFLGKITSIQEQIRAGRGFGRDISAMLHAGVLGLPTAPAKITEYFKALLHKPKKAILKKEFEIMGLSPEMAEEEAERIASLPMNPIEIGTMIASKIWEPISKTKMFKRIEAKRAILEEKGKRHEDDALTLIKKKEYGKAAGSFVLGAAQSAPLTLVAAFGGPLGLALIGEYAAGEQYDRIKDREDLNDFQKLVNPLLVGGLEYLTEMIGTASYGRMLIKMYKAGGKESVRQAAKIGSKTYFANLLKKAGIYTAPMGQSIEEATNQWAQNITNVITGINRDESIPLWEDIKNKANEGVLDAAGAGLVTGVGFAGAGAAADIGRAKPPKVPTLEGKPITQKVTMPEGVVEEAKKPKVEVKPEPKYTLREKEITKEKAKATIEKSKKIEDLEGLTIPKTDKGLTDLLIKKTEEHAKVVAREAKKVSEEGRVEAGEREVEGVRVQRAPEVQEKPPKEITKPEEIAKEHGLAYDGVQDWGEGVKLDQYTVTEEGPAKGATFNVAKGADLKVVLAKKEQIVKPFVEAEAKKPKEKVEEKKEIAAVKEPVAEKVEKPKTEISETLRKAAAKVREGKINKPGQFKMATGFDVAWDGSLEVIATSLETGADIADAISKGIEYIKSTDWYKNLTTDKKKTFDDEYRSHMESELADEGVTERAGPTISEKPTKPPTKEKKAVEEPKVRKYKIGQRAVESTKLSKDVVEAMKEHGIEYYPRGVKVTKPEAKEVVRLFAEEEGGLEKLESKVYNTANDIKGDTRTMLNVFIADEYAKRAKKAETIEERDVLNQKSVDAIVFGMQKAADYGRDVEAQKEWQRVFGENPNMIRGTYRATQDKKIKKQFEGKEGQIEYGYKTLKEVLESPEVKKHIEENISEEFNKIGTKKFGRVDKKKIDNFFNSLKIKTDNQMFDATIGIPIAAWNGSIEMIKRAVYGGADLANAIAQGAEYIDKWYRDNYNKGKLTSPKWAQEDYISIMDEKLQPLLKDVKTVKRSISPKTEKTLIDKLYEKMTMANKAQLKRLIKNSFDLLAKGNVLTEEKFRNELARAMGLEYAESGNEKKLLSAANALNNARELNKGLEGILDKTILEFDKEKSDVKVLTGLYEDIKTKSKEADKAFRGAQMAGKQIENIFADDMSALDMIKTLIQGNLLTIPSLKVNVISNAIMPVIRAPKSVIASTIDMMISGLAYAYQPLTKKINPSKYSKLYRLAQKLPGTQRVYNNRVALIEYFKGLGIGTVQGSEQLVKGQLPEDVVKREIFKGLEPVRAARRIVRHLKGEEALSADRFAASLLEAGPWAYTSEGMFRMLNLGDKPFRRAAERARLGEIAAIKGLKGVKKEKFMRFPDAESMEIAKKAGEVAVWQQDNVISNLVKDAYKYIETGKVGETQAKIKITSGFVKALAKLGMATTMPYIKTPSNLAIETFDYAMPPYAIIRSFEYARRGDRRRSIDFMAKAIVGSVISAIAISLVKNGILTPPPSEEPKERQAEYEGREGYNINQDALWRFITGGDPTWQQDDEVFSYKRFGVVSAILMAYAKAYQDVDPAEISQRNYVEMLPAVTSAVVSSSLDQTFLTGVSTGLQAIISGDGVENWLFQTERALTSSLYPNTVSMLSKAIADEMQIKEVKNLSIEGDELRNRIKNDLKDRMFMGKGLPAKVSIWGERVRRVPEDQGWRYAMFNVSKKKKYRKDYFGVKLFELYRDYKWEDEEQARKLLPSLPSARTEVGWEKSKLSPYVLEEFQIKVGLRRASYVQYYMDSEEWETDPVEVKADKLSSLYSKARNEILADMIYWEDYKDRELKRFDMLRDAGLIPFPNKRRVYRGIRLSDEEIQKVNEMALELYADGIEGRVEDFQLEDEDGKKVRANGFWNAQLNIARKAVSEERKK